MRHFTSDAAAVVLSWLMQRAPLLEPEYAGWPASNKAYVGLHTPDSDPGGIVAATEHIGSRAAEHQ